MEASMSKEQVSSTSILARWTDIDIPLLRCFWCFFFVPPSPSWAGFLALRASIYAPTAFKADYVISLAPMVCANGHRGRADLIVWMVGAEGDNCRASAQIRRRQFLSV